jgi:hypothetical protein
VSRATSRAAGASPFADDRQAQRAQKQYFDAHEDEDLGRAQHLVTSLEYRTLRLLQRLLRLLRLFRRRGWRRGGRDRPKRRALRCGAALCQGRAGRGQQGNADDGEHGTRIARPSASDRRLRGPCGQASISSRTIRPDKDRLSHSEFIFMNSPIFSIQSRTG